MVEEEKNSNSIYVVSDLLEEIFLQLPLKSILRFKTVSKQWRSILESKMFIERRMNVEKSRKIIAAYNCDCGDRPRIIHETQLEGDEVIVYIHFGDALPTNSCDAHPLMTCDGLVCIAEPESIIVLNPLTGQLLRFPSAPDPMSSRFIKGEGTDFFRGNWVMGFGRDKVTGSYKVAKMCVYPTEEGCDVLDVESGEWTNLRVPYVAHVGRNSVSVNGFIYWLSSASYLVGTGYKILALDLHKHEFHYVSVPTANWVTRKTHIANFQDRLTIPNMILEPEWILEICSMNAHEEIWSKIYSISLAGLAFKLPHSRCFMWFTPLSVSKQGDLVFYNNFRSLFKYYPETHEIRCLSSDICLISSYLENLLPLHSESGHHPDPDYYKIRTSSCRIFTKHPEFPNF